jgi:hypothetical protein
MLPTNDGNEKHMVVLIEGFPVSTTAYSSMFQLCSKSIAANANMLTYLGIG